MCFIILTEFFTLTPIYPILMNFFIINTVALFAFKILSDRSRNSLKIFNFCEKNCKNSVGSISKIFKKSKTING